MDVVGIRDSCRHDGESRDRWMSGEAAVSFSVTDQVSRVSRTRKR